MGLQRDLGDLPLGLLGPRVERRGQSRCRLGVLAAVADQLPLALGPFRELVRGRRDRLGGRLQLAGGGRKPARHGRERAALASDLANDVPDRGRGAVDADAEESQFVAGRGGAAFHLAGQVAALDLAEHAACRPQPVDDLHEHRHDRHAGEHEHEAFLDVERPAPPVPGDLRQHRDQRERGQVDDQRTPRFAPFEIERGLQRRDQVGTVEDMAVRSHGEQHRGNQQAADHEIELRVPGLERLPLHEAAHTGVRDHEAHGEQENEPPRDGDDAGELDGAEERDPESHEAPAGARVRQHVLALLGESLRDELMLETDHMRNR